MPTLSIEDLNILKVNDLFEQYQYFVETGTYMGETIFAMEPFFEKLHTIEIKHEFYQKALTKYSGDKISFHFGDSGVKIKSVCEQLDKPTLFFLDGHWSAGNTGKGDKDCPLYEELPNIMKYCNQKCIIIVDDIRLFGRGPNKGNEICNWEDINVKTVLDIVKNRLKKYYFFDSKLAKNDRLVLHLK